MVAMIKLSDYVAQFFYQLGTRHAFVVSGGASLHLIHSVDKIEGFVPVPCHHEQSAAMAADAYTRLTSLPGLAIATSGPGATNLITGICGCYYDSIPTFFITGQVSTFRMSRNPNVRQVGFQETPIVQMVKPITNYAVQLAKAEDIRYELEKAYYLSMFGRSGPVLIDIPDNLQRSLVDPQLLPAFTPPAQNLDYLFPSLHQLKLIEQQLISCARPVLIAGWGVHIAKAEAVFLRLVDLLRVPVALTWGASDLLPSTHPLRIGTFGTHGLRYANFAVQNSDFVLAIGTRLDTKSTGSPPSSFARKAFIAVNDISLDELNKFGDYGLHIDIKLHCDARMLIEGLLSMNRGKAIQYVDWINKINHWKTIFPILSEPRIAEHLVDPYIFLSRFSHSISDSAQIWSDTGSVIAWLMQSFEPRGNQRVWHDFNNTAMGWALPAAIASKFAKPQLDSYCLVGDGSLMMNIQELQTAITNQVPVKIVCFDNGGYSMIKQTQEQWLDSDYVASDLSGGLSFPDIASVATSFGYSVKVSTSTDDALHQINWLAQQALPALLLLKISPQCRVTPQVKYGRSIEDPDPPIERTIFFREMIVDSIDSLI